MYICIYEYICTKEVHVRESICIYKSIDLEKNKRSMYSIYEYIFSKKKKYMCVSGRGTVVLWRERLRVTVLLVEARLLVAQLRS
jgi:hypothetical protein